MKPLWSILILTQPSRRDFLRRLLWTLMPQVAAHPGVELIIRGANPLLELGDNRQLMREACAGEYINFIDDDDLVSDDYVAAIMPLLDGVDYVGFTLQMTSDGRQGKLTFNSLRHQRWYDDQHGFYRDISHVCPMRRELALEASMAGGFGEDHRWAEELRSLNILHTEHVIDRVLYHYEYRSQKQDGAGHVSRSQADGFYA